VRALLVPQTQLSRKLRVLIDSRFDLQRSVHKFRFGKVIDHRSAVMCPVAAARNPTNQIVPVGRGKWQDLYELDAGFTRKSHQHEIRFHRERRLLAAGVHPDFTGDRP